MVARIEYIEEVVATFAKATQANLNTPTREGNVIVLTSDAGDDVMITADLHGNRRNFNAIKRVAALKDKPRRHLVMQEVCHGGPTYPSNGGCMSHTMLEDVARLKVEFPDRFHFLLANHELAELTDYPILKQKKMLNLLFRLGMQEVYGPALEKVRQAYLPFIRSCPLAVKLPGGVLVCHSAPSGVDRRAFDISIFHRELDAQDFKEHGDLFDLLWGRDYRPENAKAFAALTKAKVLIHGHEPCPDGFSVPNPHQIILDCCGDKAGYVILPLNREFTQEEIIEQIKLLT
jgi:hypothetical protein